MKIDRENIFNRCGFDQPDCYDLAVRLAALPEDDLINEIKKINVWHYGKCELGLWADVLDILDTLLAEGVTKVGQWTLKLDQRGNEHLIGKIIAILDFTGHLLEHSSYTDLYGSWEHILALFGTSNMDVLNALLGLLYNISKRSNYFAHLDSTNRIIVLERLNSVAENWGGKQQRGFGLEECCDPEYTMPDSARTVEFVYERDTTLSITNEPTTVNSDSAFRATINGHLTLTDLHVTPESLSELIEHIIPRYFLTHTSDQMALFARLRVSAYFGTLEQRKLLIHARMQAISILCYLDEVEDKCLSYNLLAELAHIANLPDQESLVIKDCAWRTISAIIHCGKARSTDLFPNRPAQVAQSPNIDENNDVMMPALQMDHVLINQSGTSSLGPSFDTSPDVVPKINIMPNNESF